MPFRVPTNGLNHNNFLTHTFLTHIFYSLHRFSDYIDALAHLFSTGQGVVIERSPFSDLVFVEALYKCNLISKTSFKGLIETRNNALPEILKPHLVIYLDVPVNVTLVK